jgi:hypothetical protein
LIPLLIVVKIHQHRPDLFYRGFDYDFFRADTGFGNHWSSPQDGSGQAYRMGYTFSVMNNWAC